MKIQSRGAGIVALIAAAMLAGPAEAIQLGFSSEPNSVIQFAAGGTFTFEDEAAGSHNDIRITVSDGFGDAVDLTGDIDGIFTLGVITPILAIETAAVTGIGTLSIDDGAGSVLTADVGLANIATYGNFGSFNISANVNILNLSYSGSNVDLAALASSTDPVLQASFTAAIGSSLSTLAATNGTVGNYSGNLSGNGQVSPPNTGPAMPEPSGALCFAMGLAVVSAMRRRR